MYSLHERDATMSETTEIATIESAPVAGLANELTNLNNGNVAVFSTVKGADHKSRLTTLKALGNATPVADHLGKTINLKDVIVQQISLVNERTGELQDVPRITLLDADGKAFHAISDVLYKDLKNVFAILGMPHTWPAPLPVAVLKEKGKGGNFFTLSYV
jgi:hypothetical protein